MTRHNNLRIANTHTHIEHTIYILLYCAHRLTIVIILIYYTQLFIVEPHPIKCTSWLKVVGKSVAKVCFCAQSVYAAYQKDRQMHRKCV